MTEREHTVSKAGFGECAVGEKLVPTLSAQIGPFLLFLQSASVTGTVKAHS